MKTATTTAQQGDILLRRICSIPEGDRKLIDRINNKLVLAHGESGHSHVIEDDEAELLQIGERMILNLTKPATVIHEEHGKFSLEPGTWEVGRVREMDHIANITRQVID